MIDRKYSCDLCRESRDLVGIEWATTSLSDRRLIDHRLKSDRIVRKPPERVEHHVCFSCLHDLSAIFRSLAKETQ